MNSSGACTAGAVPQLSISPALTLLTPSPPPRPPSTAHTLAHIPALPLLTAPTPRGRGGHPSSHTRSNSHLRLMPICTHRPAALPLPSPHHTHSCSPRSPRFPTPALVTPSTAASPKATEIIPRLYLSDLAAAEAPAVHAALGITHVLSAMRGAITLPTSASASAPAPASTSARPHHLQLPLTDNPFAELAAHLPGATAWLAAALADPEARVLVHCVQGVSRSASVVAAFLVARFGWPPSRAVAHVKARRPGAEPNFGFLKQLDEYALSLGVAV